MKNIISRTIFALIAIISQAASFIFFFTKPLWTVMEGKRVYFDISIVFFSNKAYGYVAPFISMVLCALFSVFLLILVLKGELKKKLYRGMFILGGILGTINLIIYLSTKSVFLCCNHLENLFNEYHLSLGYWICFGFALISTICLYICNILSKKEGK